MENNISSEKIMSMLTHTDSLINHIYWFKHDFNLQPSREHIGASINYTDISERREEFLKELVTTVVSWVYNKEKSKKIVDERLSKTNFDYSNAYSFLTMQAFSKFRPGYPQGQFGELLLFNFLQFFFKSVPLLRKQNITTSLGHERFGADAVHFTIKDNKNIFLLGESKCYESKYQFKNAFEKSLTSIVQTFKSFNKELSLYTYDDFIEPELEMTAKNYKDGILTNVHFELVCLVAYNEHKNISGTDEIKIKESIQEIITTHCNSLEKDCFKSIEDLVLNRINYIIFPIWKLDDLLNEFQNLVGSK